MKKKIRINIKITKYIKSISKKLIPLIVIDGCPKFDDKRRKKIKATTIKHFIILISI